MKEPDFNDKQRLRYLSKQIRRSLTPDFRHQASLLICDLIQEWIVFKQSRTVLTYMAMGSEVDLSHLFSHNKEKEWIIPRIEPMGKMVFHSYDPGRLIHHPYGMLEPDPTCNIVSSEKIQLTLVPGLVFDLNGWRLGYGGGFYDRFLCQFEGVYAGITFHELLRPNVPHDPHDIPMQYIISEKGIFSTAKKGEP